MSSKYVRDEFKTWLTANSAETYLDLTAEYNNLNELLTAKGIGRNDDWLGLQFIGASEEPIAIASQNQTGKYREEGVVFLHLVSRAKTDVDDVIIDRGEILRNLLRGIRINDIVIQSVSPLNFETGATLQLEGGYQSAAIIVDYERDLDL